MTHWQEIEGDVWETGANIIVIPTNCAIRKDGRAVMGAGVALQATQRHPRLETRYGQILKELGCHVAVVVGQPNLVLFPTKHHWKNRGDLELIVSSAKELADILTSAVYQRLFGPEIRVAMPLVGCGHGGLDWEKQVKPAIAPTLDSFDMITVVTPLPD